MQMTDTECLYNSVDTIKTSTGVLKRDAIRPSPCVKRKLCNRRT